MVKVSDKDYTLSFKWYLNAAEKGDKESSGMVGASYYFGQGIKQDYKESFRWLLKASEKIDEKKPTERDGKLMFLMANLYFTGKELFRISVNQQKVEKSCRTGEMPSRKQCLLSSCIPDKAFYRIERKPESGQQSPPNREIALDRS